VNPDSITRVVVSHGHPDHWAGITGLLRQRDAPLKLYATADAWGEKKFLGATGIYIPSEHSEKVQREDVAGWVQLSEHLFISQPMAFHSGNGNEIFIVLKSRNGPVLISGCCHCGLDHIFEAVKEKFGAYPVALLGGLHLLERKDKLADLYAQYLQTVGCRNLYLNHCTGVTGINRLRVTLGLKGVNDFYTGQSMTFQIF
jgi:7,8-dihydropterin-6-yl-methyl-4-(beta-D-ribofuranosyl)aminobenzene 5'-phosphate synthase